MLQPADLPNVRFVFFFTSDKCILLQSDYDELESEHERLTSRHSKMIQDVDNKEAHWKDRLVCKLKILKTAPQEGAAQWFSFEWSHFRISSTDSKVRTTL